MKFYLVLASAFVFANSVKADEGMWLLQMMKEQHLVEILRMTLSFILEMLGHLPEEDESFLYENIRFTAKNVVNGRLTEVLVHILDEDDLAAMNAAELGEEVTV